MVGLSCVGTSSPSIRRFRVSASDGGIHPFIMLGFSHYSTPKSLPQMTCDKPAINDAKFPKFIIERPIMGL
jgi:hypothetical protein